jgi:hypothetical protein
MATAGPCGSTIFTNAMLRLKVPCHVHDPAHNHRAVQHPPYPEEAGCATGAAADQGGAPPPSQPLMRAHYGDSALNLQKISALSP